MYNCTGIYKKNTSTTAGVTFFPLFLRTCATQFTLMTQNHKSQPSEEWSHAHQSL
uniref:Uncharacterized protein n=1 Tax=Oryza brachyantha TaxID=4533 RepID=J3LGJ4_ORYBR